MSRASKVAISVTAVVIIVVAALLPAFIRARMTPAKNACVNNLRQLDGAKQQWELENRRSKGDPVTWENITPYLKNTLVCPGAALTYSVELGKCRGVRQVAITRYHPSPIHENAERVTKDLTGELTHFFSSLEWNHSWMA